jgi:hypothetical protein
MKIDFKKIEKDVEFGMVADLIISTDYIATDIYEYLVDIIFQDNSHKGYMIDPIDLENELKKSVIKTEYSVKKLIELELMYKNEYGSCSGALDKFNLVKGDFLHESRKLYIEIFDLTELVSSFRLMFLSSHLKK